MFLLILYPVVALLTTLVSPLPQSNEDGNSLGSAKSANDDLPQQRGLFNRPSELSISDDDNQEAPVEDLVISSTEPIQADPASNFITSNKEESVPPNNQIADLDSDELVNLTGDQAKDEELNKGAEKSSCTDSKGNAIGESKGSTACPNPMPDSPPKLHTPPKIPDSDLGQKLPQNLPVGNPLRHLELRNFCPPGFLAFCCHGPNRKKLQQGDALEDCHDFVSKKECTPWNDHVNWPVVVCCHLEPILYYDRTTGRSSYWAFGCVEPRYEQIENYRVPPSSPPPPDPNLEPYNRRPL